MAQRNGTEGRGAKITAETQVKNEYTTAQTFTYAVVIEDAAGKQIKTITGGNYTLAPGEVKAVSASAPVSELKFWSWGYGYLYNVYTVLKVNGAKIKPSAMTVPRSVMKQAASTVLP